MVTGRSVQQNIKVIIKMGFWVEIIFFISAYFLLRNTLRVTQQKAYEQGYQNAIRFRSHQRESFDKLALEKAYKQGQLHGVLLSLDVDGYNEDEAPATTTTTLQPV